MKCRCEGTRNGRESERKICGGTRARALGRPRAHLRRRLAFFHAPPVFTRAAVFAYPTERFINRLTRGGALVRSSETRPLPPRASGGLEKMALNGKRVNLINRFD